MSKIILLLLATLSGCASIKVPTAIEATEKTPVTALTVQPLSRTADTGVDFTPGLAGAILNTVKLATFASQVVSDKYRVLFLYKQNSLFNAQPKCLIGSAIVSLPPTKLGELEMGDQIRFFDGQDSVDFSIEKNGQGNRLKISDTDYCFPTYLTLEANPDAIRKPSAPSGQYMLGTIGGQQ